MYDSIFVLWEIANGFIFPDGVPQEGEDCEGVTVLRGVEMAVSIIKVM